MNPTESHVRSQAGRDHPYLHAAALILILLAARLPFWTHPTPVHPDEVSFVEAIGFPANYPVHAPGYPLWIATGTLLSSATATKYAAFAAASLVASIAGPLLMFVWLRSRFGNPLALSCTLAFALCPLAWFHGVTALTYWAATLVGLAVVVACDRAIRRQDARFLWAASIVLAIGVFLRTDCLIYFGPLFAFALWRIRKVQARAAALAPIVAFAGFYVLMHSLYGRGGATIFADRFAHSRQVLLGTSLFGAGFIDGLLRNLLKIAVNLTWNVGPLAVVFACTWLLKRCRDDDATSPMDYESDAPARTRAARTLPAIWVLTGLTFLALFHVVEGYFLWVLPGIYIIAADRLQRRIGARSATRCMIIVVLVSIAQFLGYPWSAESTGEKRTLDAKIAYLSAMGLMQIDERDRIHEDGDYWRTKAHDAEGAATAP